MKPPGCGHRLECGWPYGVSFDYSVLRHLPLVRIERESQQEREMEDAPPARQRVLNTRGGRKIARLDTSVFRWRRLSR
jgi:hypothetical protein